jgi:hypothetical protein
VAVVVFVVDVHVNVTEVRLVALVSDTVDSLVVDDAVVAVPVVIVAVVDVCDVNVVAVVVT